jgi:acetoin utilization deacetylase AcuC-like enzyme
MVSDPGNQPLDGFLTVASPSARKPKEIAEALAKSGLNIEFVEPEPVTIEDFKRCHSSELVDGVMSLKLENGFGTRSQSVVDSLPYTNGAQYTAAKLATSDSPTCSLVSGFHHAGYKGWEGLGYFCTFNGLMVASTKLLAEGVIKKIAIIDCDQHWGNGTDDILGELFQLKDQIGHISFGRYFDYRENDWKRKDYANHYLEWFGEDGWVNQFLDAFKPDLIIYQAGADTHVDDPYGGVLTTEEMYQRDLRMFQIAKEKQIPLTWNLAGGYQVEKDGSIDKVIQLHMNTFKACKEVYGNLC